ncbi:hypothetical protein LCGC14_1663240 [marine sediment metagenome]|uniref:AP2/ERF domain-containing protein n=1 Tax=marine sediment metagenome TaxID=412755 RepID=A0A0F9HU76_9ZZZZ
MTAINMTGKTFSNLTALRRAGSDKSSAALWECECSCGVTKIVRGASLRRGLTTSCGCIQIERSRNYSTKHGMSKTPIYTAWSDMKQRCLNTKAAAYSDYGGRGISVSVDWLVFENFYNDMRHSYEKGLELDRIDNEKGYSASNCRWSDRRTNCSNTRAQLNRNYPVGVYRTGDRYQCRITVDRKTINLGVFDSVEAASERYMKYVKELSRDKSFS